MHPPLVTMIEQDSEQLIIGFSSCLWRVLHLAVPRLMNLPPMNFRSRNIRLLLRWSQTCGLDEFQRQNSCI